MISMTKQFLESFLLKKFSTKIHSQLIAVNSWKTSAEFFRCLLPFLIFNRYKSFGYFERDKTVIRCEVCTFAFDNL